MARMTLTVLMPEAAPARVPAPALVLAAVGTLVREVLNWMTCSWKAATAMTTVPVLVGLVLTLRCSTGRGSVGG